MKRFVGQSAFNLAGNFSRVLMSLFTTIVATQALGAADFGFCVLVISYTIFFHYLGGLGFEQSLPYLFQKKMKEGEDAAVFRLISAATISSFGLSLIFCLSGAIIASVLPNISETLRMTTYLLIFHTLFTSVGSVFSGIMRSTGQIKQLVIKDQILNPLSFFVCTVILCVWFRYGSSGYAVALLISSVSTFLFGFIVTRKYFRFGSLQVIPDFLSLKYSASIGLTSAIEPLLQWGMIAILGWYASTVEIALYSIALRVSAFSGVLSLVLSPVFSSVLAQQFHEGQTKQFSNTSKNLLHLTTVWALLFCFAILTISKEVFSIFGLPPGLGKEIFFILTAALVLDNTTYIFKNIFVSMGKGALNLVSVSVSAVSLLVAVVFLVPSFGALGAGLSTLFSNMVTVVFRCRQAVSIGQFGGLKPKYSLVVVPFVGLIVAVGSAYLLQGISFFPRLAILVAAIPILILTQVRLGTFKPFVRKLFRDAG